MKKKKVISIIMLVIGILPFIIALLVGLDKAINGFSFLWGPAEYGFDAFLSGILFFSYLFWPAYFIGLLLIIGAIIHLIPAKE